ncbi:MAG: AraC family transcriptional regulator [Solobacterium sp.]|nr:AraC family transcriptional regulator [Solobacterium sp.]
MQDEKKFRFYVAQDDLFIDLNLVQFGWEKCAPLHQFGPAVRNHFLFHYIIDGKGSLETNGQKYFLKKGQGFLLCPGQISTYYADPDDPWYYTWIEFDGLRARQSLTLAGLSEQQPIYTSTDPARHSLQDYMLQIVNEGERSPIRLTGMGMILLDELVQTSMTRIQEEKKSLRDFYMREAINYIEENYMHDISIEEIADVSGLNRSYFSRIFKEAFSVSPQKFLLQYRMTKAADLLKNTKLPIHEIGRSVGYDNQLHFSRAFKTTFGIAPSSYRDEHHIQIL